MRGLFEALGLVAILLSSATARAEDDAVWQAVVDRVRWNGQSGFIDLFELAFQDCEQDRDEEGGWTPQRVAECKRFGGDIRRIQSRRDRDPPGPLIRSAAEVRS